MNSIALQKKLLMLSKATQRMKGKGLQAKGYGWVRM